MRFTLPDCESFEDKDCVISTFYSRLPVIIGISLLIIQQKIFKKLTTLLEKRSHIKQPRMLLKTNNMGRKCWLMTSVQEQEGLETV